MIKEFKKYLGSNRVVFADDGTIKQVNDYYPFGALMSNGWLNTSSQKYKYIGKELDRTFGYDMYDNGARWNNSILVRWETMDKLAENNFDFSPYVDCNDNPLKYKDDDGNIVKTFHLWNNDAKTCTFYRSPTDFKSAMMKFAKTSFGNQILADFTPKGSSIFGAKGNGKLKFRI